MSTSAGLEAAQAEAVGDDEDAGEGHGGSGEHGTQEPGGGEGQGADVVGLIIAGVAVYVAHGAKATTTVALLGTVVSVLVIALLAVVAVSFADLTGLDEGAAGTLRITADTVDLRGLLIAGIVVGSLGVLDDVTVTQVAAVVELRNSNPTLHGVALYRSALRIGRDHVAAVVNTLVLAYAGASLPLLLLFAQGDTPFGRIASSQIVAVEIVRTIVGSIGLVLSVPLTTALAAAVLLPTASAPGEDGAAAEVDEQPAHNPTWDDFAPDAEYLRSLPLGSPDDDSGPL